MFESYIPLMLMVATGFGVAVAFLLLAEWLGARRSTRGKKTTYESGMEPIGNARDRFSVKYYMVAMSFIVFDVEVLFIYPWAVRFKSLPGVAIISMAIFILILLAGYIYELRKGGLDWD